MATTENSNGNKPVPRRQGRKPSIQHSPDTQDRFINAIKAGNYANVAAQYAGIHVATYHRYMQLGSEQTKGIYRDFYEAVKEAEAEAEAVHWPCCAASWTFATARASASASASFTAS